MRLNPTRNVAETEFVERTERTHPRVSIQRRGWPDYWWTDENGRLCVAEVKRTFDCCLREHQYVMLRTIRENIPDAQVYVWVPRIGLLPFDVQDWTEVFRKGCWCYYLNHDKIRDMQPGPRIAGSDASGVWQRYRRGVAEVATR